MRIRRNNQRLQPPTPVASVRAVERLDARPQRPAGAVPRRRRGWHLTAAVALLMVTAELVVGPASPASAAGCTGNTIVCENQKLGTPQSQWDIVGAGDDSIQGYTTDISADVGQTIGFKIDTPANAYTIKIFRLGYYGGDGARFIANVTPSASLPQIQPACVTNTSTEIYDCGTWAVSASWTVPSTAVSGVYFALLQRSDTGGASQIPFVVRNDASTSPLYFKTSDETWQAYNNYGGANFYSGGDNGRAYKLSYNRPYATRNWVDGQSFLFSNEFPMIEFLERNGYDVSYTTDIDADRHGALLKQHATMLSVGHDEYWSYTERANVEAARDAGVNLAFFSGNEVYWRTRWENSEDGSNTPYRTMVSYKETWANAKIDPSDQWTGTYRDPRFSPPAIGGDDPENSLTGTMYMANNTDLALQVPAAQGKDRIWRDTSVASLAPGATATLAPHTVGYESDEDLDNGFRPSGLIDMSTTIGATPMYLQDYGTNTLPGTTTHHITLYKAASGALVFGAGTIQWSWGLSADHDGTQTPPDPAIQQATVNILADMGASATTVQSGLTATSASTDTVGPTVSIASPAQNITVPNGSVVTVSGTATDADGGVVAGVEVSTDGGMTWHPATGTAAWSYTFYSSGAGTQTVLVRGVDDSANQGAPAPLVLKLSGQQTLFGDRVPKATPDPDSTPVSVGVKFSPLTDGNITGIRFYKGAGNTGTHTGSLWTNSGAKIGSGTFSGESGSGWQTLTFSSPVHVTAGTNYIASYYAPHGHVAGDNYAFPAGWTNGQLSVVPSYAAGANGNGMYIQNVDGLPDVPYQDTNYYVDVTFVPGATAPSVVSTTPLDAAGGVALTMTPSATFGTTMTSSSVTFELSSGGADVGGTSSYSAATKTVTFTPSAPLTPGAVYTATVNGTASDGTAMISAKTWSFTTTSSSGDTYSLFSVTATPATADWDDPNPNELGVQFSSDVDGYVTGVRFYKGPTNTGTHTGSLWSATGQRLATATFSGESASGWQTVTFPNAVAITKNTTYTASYFAPTGNYAIDLNTLASGLDNGPLHVPDNGGVYGYGPSGFPSSQIPHNVWVDVSFTTTKPKTPPTVTSVTPVAGATAQSISVKPSATFSTSMSSSSLVFTVKSGTTSVDGTVAYSDANHTATFTPSAPLSNGVTYSVSLTGSNTDGTAMDNPYTWTFTTVAAADGSTQTIFPASSTPANVNWDDPNPNSLGVKFTSDVAGQITGVRFYKGPLNTGIHTGSLWTASGTLLTSATFATESASGWQSVTFAQPVTITPNTVYVASYTTTTGDYAVDLNTFTDPLDSGHLHVPANGGLYDYAGGFPSNPIPHNLWVDVVFQPAG